ncbi:MAG: peptidylprolyl isomerase [Candidatus Aminicenantes bacterium]|nr:peptidylprolyl isomerase [Candidatus Aminicenantes bacterium]
MNMIPRCVSLLWIPLLGMIAACGNNRPAPQQKESPATSSAPMESPIVLKVDELKFSRTDFAAYLSSRYPDLKLDSSRAQLLSRLFDGFIEYQILRYRADQAGVKVTADELPELTERLQLPADSLPRPILLETARIQKYLYFNYFRQQEVTDNEISEYYRLHRNDFQQETEVHLYQILLSDKDQAIELRGILQNAPDRFEELARTRSLSPEATENGYMGIFEKGTLPEEMENVVFSLRPHQISPVVESKFGFHIFKVTSRSNRRTLPLQRVKDQIRSDLMSQKLRTAYEVMLEEARESLQIEIVKENLGFTYFPETGDHSDETDH